MSRPNVLYVTIDSIRADHVGHLGYNRETTPAIDQLAKQGTACTHAVANGIPTFYSFKSLLGGVRSLGCSHDIGMPKETTPIAEVFRNAGYETAGFNAGNPWLTRGYGYNRGFETFRDFLTDKVSDDGADAGSMVMALARRAQPIVERSELLKDTAGFAARVAFAAAGHTPLETAETVTDEAIAWLERRTNEQPFFLWIHYMDPHYPWVPRKRDIEPFREEPIGTWSIGSLWHTVASLNHAEGDAVTVSTRDHERITDLYDAEVRRTDESISRLLNAAETNSDRAETAIGIVGDHGTELGDHGGFSHGPRKLYDELLRVPLVFGGSTAPTQQIDRVTSLVDVPRSLLALAEIDPPPVYAGHSVFDSTGDAASAEVVYDYEPASGSNADNDLLRAHVDPPWKLIVNDEHGTRELYHLADDPAESIDLAGEQPVVADRLHADLDRARERRTRNTRTIHEKHRVTTKIMELKRRGRI
ncbi:sulfatase [Halalkalirubrum salinum]|uniref:sulfatase n=1 Tax=Halalkalirubrum salinum TaxID=2563889 RepID=UPI001484DC0E|nr:sulfatase [Halalkalirubrum salinum]